MRSPTPVATVTRPGNISHNKARSVFDYSNYWGGGGGLLFHTKAKESGFPCGQSQPLNCNLQLYIISMIQIKHLWNTFDLDGLCTSHSSASMILNMLCQHVHLVVVLGRSTNRR